MAADLKTYLQDRGEWISSHLLSFLPPNMPKTLYNSMKYSLDSGGKRIRPILLIATLEALGKPKELGLEVATAIEMIHTYSLIHDDLPAMDNDDFRRGIPTNHKVFGDGIAILAGDALLTYAIEIIASSPKNHPQLEVTTVLDLIKNLCKAIGPEGMVGGQLLDLEGEGQQLNIDDLEQIHRRKTGELIHFAVMAGATLGKANEEQRNRLSHYARNLGLAFQIQDDILDIVGDVEKIGKAIGSDLDKEKSTYPSLLGLEQSKRRVSRLINEAKASLETEGIDPLMLGMLADYMVWRDS